MEISPDIRPVGAALIQADRRTGGWTDMTKLLVAYRFVRRHFSNTRHAVWMRSKYITEIAVFSKQNSTPPKFPHYCKVYALTFKRRFFLIKPTDAIIFPNLFLSRNATCFGQFLCPSSGVFHCTFRTGICRASLMTAFKHIQDGTGSILVLLESCLQTCMTYTIAECTVNILLMMDRRTVRNM